MESFLEAVTPAWNFKKQVGDRTEGVMEGLPTQRQERSVPSEHCKNLLSPELGLKDKERRGEEATDVATG